MFQRLVCFFSSQKQLPPPPSQLQLNPCRRLSYRQIQNQSANCKIVKWSDGTVYIGECKQNLMHGKGQLIYPNGEYYEGEFLQNNFHGFGKYNGADSIYEGQWENGIKCGNAKQTNVDGSVYCGRFCNGVKQGMGIFEWTDGSIYEGMFKDDKMSGIGKMTYSNGEYIQGEWQQNQISGLCKVKQGNGNLYIGSIKNGIKHGQGILHRKKQKLQGTWKNGKLANIAILIDKLGNCNNIKIENCLQIKINDEEYQKLLNELKIETQGLDNN